MFDERVLIHRPIDVPTCNVAASLEREKDIGRDRAIKVKDEHECCNNNIQGNQLSL